MGSGFFLQAEQTLPSKPSLLFYPIHGSASVPFQGKVRCATTPTRRTPVQTSNATGAPPRTGVYSLDFDLRIASGADMSLVVGQQAWAQCWTRDGGGPSGTGLTDAVTFTIGL